MNSENLMAASYPASVENPSAPYFISSTLRDEARADCGKYRQAAGGVAEIHSL